MKEKDDHMTELGKWILGFFTAFYLCIGLTFLILNWVC